MFRITTYRDPYHWEWLSLMHPSPYLVIYSLVFLTSTEVNWWVISMIVLWRVKGYVSKPSKPISSLLSLQHSRYFDEDENELDPSVGHVDFKLFTSCAKKISWKINEGLTNYHCLWCSKKILDDWIKICIFKNLPKLIYYKIKKKLTVIGIFRQTIQGNYVKLLKKNHAKLNCYRFFNLSFSLIFIEFSWEQIVIRREHSTCACQLVSTRSVG